MKSVPPHYIALSKLIAFRSTYRKAMNRDHKHAHNLHKRIFGDFAELAATKTAMPWAFMLALIYVIAWALAGPLVHYSETWEMFMTIVPSIVTFLLVFLIQNAQYRETMAIQLKLNELIRATEGAHTTMVNLEKLTADELLIICEQYEALALDARRRLSGGQSDMDVPDISLADVPDISLNKVA